MGAPMSTDRYRAMIERMIAPADIGFGGERPWDVEVHDQRVFRRILTSGTLGIGEAYMDGWWDCPAIDQLVERAARNGVTSRLTAPVAHVHDVVARVRNLQSKRRAFQVGEHHYDVGNDLYAAMLDDRMIYSCGYWRDAADLDDAQEAKLALVRNKLAIEPGMRVLDIGCGWGGAARHLAETTGCSVLGVTVSREQAALARERCHGLPVEIRVQDYRDVRERFDRVYSIGMFEHVGVRNYRTYFETVRDRLSDPDGLTLLHTIGGSRSKHITDPWMERYIFPNSVLPSAAQIMSAAEGLLVLEDWHNFGADYDTTLMAWHARIEAAWPDLPHLDERFRRMWRFYLLSSAGMFRARALHLWQVVSSRDGSSNVYGPPGIR